LNRLYKKSLLIFLSLLFIFPAALALNIDALTEYQVPSRGMALFFTAFIVLLAIPLLNKQLKTLSFYIIIFALARGLMRITDEQDPVRIFYSASTGLKLGLYALIPLVGITAVIILALLVMKKVKAIPSLSVEEIIEFLNEGKRKGKTLEEMRGELNARGVKDAQIEKALSLLERR